MTSLGFTTRDLEVFPEDNRFRFEIICGELYVSKQPDYEHQLVCGLIFAALQRWSDGSGLGAPLFAPGVIYADDDNVAPDLVWVSKQRLESLLGPDRKLHGSPELIVEVLSPGSANLRRDRETKLALYSRREVPEYWIVDWERRQVEVYRRAGTELRLVETLQEGDTLTSPQLPRFACTVSSLFAGFPLA